MPKRSSYAQTIGQNHLPVRGQSNVVTAVTNYDRRRRMYTQMRYTVVLRLQMLKYAENLKHLTVKEFCKG